MSIQRKHYNLFQIWRNMDSKTKLDMLRTEGRKVPHDHGYKSEHETKNYQQNNSDTYNIDVNKLNEGIYFFQQNFFSMFVSMLTGLLSLMYIESIAAVLHTTKKSNSAPLSFSRYLSTLNHTLAWYKNIPELLKSSSKVRQLHRQASKMKNFSQYEMVITQWAFVGPALLWPHKLGIDDRSFDGFEGLICVMYHVGKQLGICDEYNLCAGSYQEVKEYCKTILEQEIQPTFLSQKSSKISKQLSQSLLDGVHILNPFIIQDGFRAWTDVTVNYTPVEELDKNLDPFSKIMFRLQLKVMQLFHVPVLGAILRFFSNNLMKLNIYLATDWQEYIVAGFAPSEHSVKNKDARLELIKQAFIIIPGMVLISLFGCILEKAKTIKTELLIFSSFSIFLILFQALL